MVVFDENMGYTRFFIENLIFFLIFVFVPGIILDHFSNRKSIFGYRKVEILRFLQVFFDSQIESLIEKLISRLKKLGKT